MDRGTVTEPQTEAGRTLARHLGLEGDEDILAIERQAADAALAALAETVEKLEPKPGMDGVSGWFFDGWNEAIAAVLDAIAKARKETT